MNIKRAAVFLLLFQAVSIFAQELAARYNFQDFTQTPQKIKTLTIEPLFSFGVNGTNIVTGDRRTFVTDTSGSKVVSNILAGYSYRVTIAGSYSTTVFTNYFGTNVTGLVDASDPEYLTISTNLNDNLTAYSKAQADARFAPIGSTGGEATNVLQVAAGDGVVVDTNSLVRTVSVDAAYIAGITVDNATHATTADSAETSTRSTTADSATSALDSKKLGGIGVELTRLNRSLSHSIQTNLSNIFTNESFPSMACSPDRSTIAVIFRGADIHGLANSCLLLSKTTDGGASWTTPITVVTNAGFDSRNQSFTITSSGRYVLFYQRRNVDDTSEMEIVCTVSDNQGETWVEIWSSSAIDSPYTTISGAGYDSIKEIDGVLHVPVYATITAFTSATYDYTSSDWGTNWTPHTIIASTNGWVEPAILPITRRELFAVTRMGAPRDLYTLRAWWSDSSGTNWADLGDITTLTKGSNAAPVALSLMQSDSGPQIVMALGDRADGWLKIGAAAVSEVKTNPSALMLRAKKIAQINSNGGIFLDGGYPSMASLSDGEYLISYYYADASVTNSAEIRFAQAQVSIPIMADQIANSTINSNKFDAATLALFGAGGGGDVTADGNNAFTGDNTHSGTETFSGSVILPAATVGTNNAVQAEWNDFIDARITTGTDSPTNFLGAPGSGATGASFNASALTNASPALATNNATASDGWVLSKTGDNLKLVAQSAGAGGGLTTNDVKAITGQTRVYNVMDYGATGDGFTDDTPAIQATIDAAVAPTNRATIGVVFFPIPTNYYRLAAPATNIGQSQLVIRDKAIDNTNISTIVLMGEGYDNNWAGTAVGGAMPTGNAPVIFSTSTNTGDCVLRSTINTIESPFYPTRITIEIKNLSFRTTTSFRGSVINFTNVTNCSIEQSDIMKDVGPSSITTLPNDSIGFWGPDKDNGNYCYLDKVNVVGYGKGLVLGEHVTAPFLNVVACRKAVVFQDSNLGNWIGHVTIQQCNYGIFFEGDSKVKIDHAVFETANADWKTNIMDISGDVNTYGHGWIGWSKKDNANSRHLDLSKERTWYIHTYSYGENALLSSSQATDLKDRGPAFQYVDNSARSAGYTFEKARGTPRDKTIVSSGDQWGPQFAGYNGTKYVTGSTVYGYVDGTPSSTSMPMGVTVMTGTNDTSLTRKLDIPVNGFVKFYNTFAVTNAPTFVTTNAAPAGVTWGTTVPDAWIRITNNGVGGSVPWFKD